MPDYFQPGCRGFAVVGGAYLGQTPAYKDENGLSNVVPIGAYLPGQPYPARYTQDEGYQCPANPKLRAAGRTGPGKGGGAVMTSQQQVSIGGRTATRTQWTIPCWTEGPLAGEPVTRTTTTFTERQWYLPAEKVLIVDDIGVPGLDQILARATWT